jgi:hypothetical protein
LEWGREHVRVLPGRLDLFERRGEAETTFPVKLDAEVRCGLMVAAAASRRFLFAIRSRGAAFVVTREKAEKEIGGLARLRGRADDGAVVLAQHIQ